MELLPAILLACISYLSVQLYHRLHKARCSPLRDIPGPNPQSWFKGNLGQLFNRKGLKYHHDLVKEFGNFVKVYGFFGDEQLYISDPRALQSILVKDQDTYDETDVFLECNKIVFGEGLVSTSGEQHKRQRRITTPIFSVAQLKELTPVIYEVAEKLGDVISIQTKERRPIDMAEWMSRAALETLGQTVLGHSFDPLNSQNNNDYSAAIRGLIPALFSIALLRQFAPFLARMGSPRFRRFLVDMTPVPVVQRIKGMSDVMYNTARDILRNKLAGIEDDHSRSPPVSRDVISTLLRANRDSNEKLSEDELIGQMTVIIFGAQDTTSSALSRMLYMLSQNQEVQTELRAEIAQAKVKSGDERLGYDDILALPLLDAVIKETLRLYPPVPFVRRVAKAEGNLPLSQPIIGTSNNEISTVPIPKGTTIFLGLAAANRLESVWGPDARQWNPQRWLGTATTFQAEKSVNSAAALPSIYAGMLSFLAGSRSCIGYKFAIIEMKIILSTLLERFSFAPTEDEVVWNLSQIISPSVRSKNSTDDSKSGQAPGLKEEVQGLPLLVTPVSDDDL